MIYSIKKLVSAIRYREDSTTALLKEYERGREDATAIFQNQVKSYNDRIAELTGETVRLDERLRKIHEERLDNIEDRWTDRCKRCKEHIEDERKRLRSMQNLISKYLADFTIVFNKLFKHATFVDTAHDTILSSAAQVKASKNMLSDIRVEAQGIINRVEPILQLTEEDVMYAKEGVLRSMLEDQRGPSAADGRGTERAGAVLDEDQVAIGKRDRTAAR